jgi:tripartite-type tricarboxylate transporter receptor subunit TctC
MQYVHYRGGAPLMVDLITGRVDFSFASFNSARSNMDARKLRPLAVDADARITALPDTPTLIETGLGKYKVADWFGLVAPAGTPKPIVDKLNQEFVKAAKSPELIQKLVANGNAVATSSPEEMKRMIAADVESLAKLVKTLGLSIK